MSCINNEMDLSVLCAKYLQCLNSLLYRKWVNYVYFQVAFRYPLNTDKTFFSYITCLLSVKVK